MSAAPADIKVVGDQLIISGRASGNELALVRDAISEHGGRVTTVILREYSGRTNNDDVRRIAEIFSERGWRTAVSGFCGTACAQMFMGGLTRHFTDDGWRGGNSIQFGSTTRVEDSRGGALQFSGDKHMQGNQDFRGWLKSRSAGRLSDALMDRLFVADHSVRYLHFYDPRWVKRSDRASILYCDGREKPAERWQVCEKLANADAFTEGIVNSEALVRSNDLTGAAPAGSSARQ